MAKPYFTLNLDVVRKPCLVVGGDEEALEKSERLVEAQADLTVVARKIIPELVRLCEENQVKLHRREFQDSDIPGKFFVLNCVKTEKALSQRIYRLCLDNHAICSSYDQPEESNAVMQALVRAGLMRIAIGSGGASPGLASALRKSFEGMFDLEFAQFTKWVAGLREEMIGKGATPKERKAYFQDLLKDFKVEGAVRYPQAWLDYKKKLKN